MEELINALSWIDTVAATVWIVLTVIMFWILYRVHDLEGKKHPIFKFGIFLLVLVWLYPLYTFVFNQLEVGFAGNLITLWATISYASRLKAFKKLAIWMIPQIVWIVLASIYVGLLLANKYLMA